MSNRHAGIHIRDARIDDVPAIAEVHVAAWQSTYRDMLPDAALDALTPEERRPMWQHVLTTPDPSVAVWVAESDATIVGICAIGRSQDATSPDTAELHLIYIRPGWERPVTGRALMERVDAALTARGIQEACLWVHPDNHRAGRFYETLGWQPDGAHRQAELWGQMLPELRYRKKFGSRSDRLGNI